MTRPRSIDVRRLDPDDAAEVQRLRLRGQRPGRHGDAGARAAAKAAPPGGHCDLSGFIIDCQGEDLDAAAAFWSAALGAVRLEAVKGWHVMQVPTGQRFCVVPRLPSR